MNVKDKFILTGVLSTVGMFLCNCGCSVVMTSLFLRLTLLLSYPSERVVGVLDLMTSWLEPNVGSYLQISMNCGVMSKTNVSKFLLLNFIIQLYIGNSHQFIAVCVLPILLQSYLAEKHQENSLFPVAFVKLGSITRDILGLWSPNLKRFIYLNRSDLHLELELFQILKNLEVKEEIPFNHTLDERFSYKQTFIRIRVNCIKVRDESFYLVIGTRHSISRYSRMFLEAMTHELRTPLHIMLGIMENTALEQSAVNLSEKLTVCRNCVLTVSTIVDNLIECCEKTSPNNREEIFKLNSFLKKVFRKLRLIHDIELKVLFDNSITIKSKRLLMKKFFKSIFNFLKGLSGENLIHIAANFTKNLYDCSLDVKFEVAVFNHEYVNNLFQIVQKLYKNSFENSDSSQGYNEGIFLLSSYYALSKQFANRLNAEMSISILDHKLQIRVTQSVHQSFEEVSESESSFDEGIIAAINDTIALRKSSSMPYNGGDEDIPVERDENEVHKNSFLGKRIDEDSHLLKYNLLIVEDITICAEIVMRYVNQLGLDFKWAKNGHEAIEFLLSEKFDLILMDYMMPLLNGIEATRKIREIERYNKMKPIPIIGITANSTIDLKKECIESGMNEVLSKPLPFKLLKERLKFYLGTLHTNCY
jgi:CheY-like chemotaxis protein/signal transduction histidine kinase